MGYQFNWSSQEDETTFITFRGLRNKMDGRYRSKKQKAFLENNFQSQYNPNTVGVELYENEWVASASGYHQFSTHQSGPRGEIPFLHFWIMDEVGVVAEYKVGFKGNMRDGATADPEKVQILWERETKATQEEIDSFKDEPKESEEEQESVEVPEGRQSIRGKVVSLKVKSSAYGDQLKMLVVDDRGFKVFGSVPDSLWEVNMSDMVEFVARIEPKEDSFGFFKRPTKAQIVNVETT